MCWSRVVVAPRLGAATMIATIIAGQMLASLLLDHFGVAGYAHHPVNAWRIDGRRAHHRRGGPDSAQLSRFERLTPSGGSGSFFGVLDWYPRSQ